MTTAVITTFRRRKLKEMLFSSPSGSQPSTSNVPPIPLSKNLSPHSLCYRSVHPPAHPPPKQQCHSDVNRPGVLLCLIRLSSVPHKWHDWQGEGAQAAQERLDFTHPGDDWWQDRAWLKTKSCYCS